VLYVDQTTGAADLSLDETNPRILYAGMWEHRRFPWAVKSGGPGSGLYKSTDGGDSWERLTEGLPDTLGKVAIDVSPANPNRVFANIEAEGKKGGVYRSDDAGATWSQVCSDRVTVARAWYYIEIFADPTDQNTVYVLNAPMLKSIDGGKSFRPIANPHGDQHHLWINPQNNQNMILANDGGACVSFTGGASWSTQQNQPTAQFYRVIADEQFPYKIYAGQQDNSAIEISSRTRGGGITWKDWRSTAGGESAFIAFDNPKAPRYVFGGSYQGNISVYDNETGTEKDIMAYPVAGLGTLAKKMRYRFNWNAPIVAQPQDPSILYHAGNVVLRSTDKGDSWEAISEDLTRNDTTKQEAGGYPFTNEGAGGENYNTISYLTASPHQAGELWVGTDDGLVWRTTDEGENWMNVTPPNIGEVLINAIEVSPHDPNTAFLAVTGYKFNDFSPGVYVTTDGGKTWRNRVEGIEAESFVRVIREDPKVKDLLYAGTERGLYVSFDAGGYWEPLQLNLPVSPILDLTIRDNDLIVATSGRAFWILDDLSALQQSKGTLDTDLILFEPKPTYRYNLSGGGGRERGAANPAAGIIFDYYLPEEIDTSVLKVEVLDETGTVIRSYTNQKAKGFKTWPGGPPRPQVIPSAAGINRFNWDLRREQMPAVEGVFTLGDYRGSLVPPGNYTLRLTAPSDTLEVTAALLADPTLDAEPAAYTKQQAILQPIEAMVKDIHGSVSRMRKVKQQLESLNGLLKDFDNTAELREAGQGIINQITTWEENLIQPDQKTFQDVINFPNQLNAELMNLKSRVDGAVPAATAGAKERLADLRSIWSYHLGELNRIIDEEVGGFNEQYKELGLPALILPAGEKAKQP
ncbi:MAG: glycosyl hydrolase, partial [Bacteroidota bacterium]